MSNDKPDAPIVSTEQAATAAPSAAAAMPAGDARREEMKRDADALNAQAAAFREKYQGDVGSIPADKLDPANVDNDIVREFDPITKMLEVQDKVPGKTYLWEQADIHGRFGGFWVTARKAVGWEVVASGPNFPEARNLLAVDGTRRCGDAILMRIDTHRYEELERADRRRRVARMQGVSVKLIEQAEKAGVLIHDLVNPSTPRARDIAKAQVAAAEAARATMVSTMRQAGRGGMTRALASEIANKRIDGAIRAGTVAGLTPGR